MPPAAPARRALASVCLALAALAPAVRAADAPPLIDLDAASLPVGPVTAWPNGGAAGGTFAADAGTAPAAADVGGRRAVSFAAGRHLTSSFPTPAGVAAGRPFTLAVWAFAPEVGRRGVVASWAARPRNAAEFGYGTGPDGAFYGGDKAARFARVPAAGRWHHLAYSFAADALSVYVDGSLDARRPLALAAAPGGRVHLGTGWDAATGKAAAPFAGSLARVQVWDRALTHREVRNAAGWFDPFDPTPADGGPPAAEGLRLAWQPGGETVAAYAVRVAPDAAAAAADGDGPGVHRVPAPGFTPAGVTPGAAYFWRVDQLDAAGKVAVKGPVWRFATDGGPATAPAPRDRVAAVRRDIKGLSWAPGRYARGQTVYFGPDRDAVAAGTAALARGLPPTATTAPLPAGGLEAGRTYYWRVEQDNGPLPPARGEVWAFRTADDPAADEVTFFVGSDCHYGLGINGEINRKVIDEMNWLPGTAMPRAAGGGVVRTPRGVVLNGDLLDKGFEPKTAPAAWAEFVKDYGLTGADGRLAYPVYEGFGNHDGPTGRSTTRDGVRERNKTRPGLTAVSPNGLHYSWDWGNVHVVQLNLYPGKDTADSVVGPANHPPDDSLGFLKDDLAGHVGDSGKVVVVCHHYCYAGGMADWWTEAAKGRAYEAVKKYRTVLVHGHSHGAYFYDWKGIQVVSDGSTARPESQTGDFLVVRVTKDELCVAQRKLDGWGVCLKVPLPAVGRPEGRPPVGPGQPSGSAP